MAVLRHNYARLWIDCQYYAIVGVEDQLMPIDSEVWARSMIEESRKPPPLCSSEFKENIVFFMNTLLGKTLSDITHENCREIYVFLTEFIESIIN